MITPLSKVIDLKFNLNETNKSLLFRTATGKQFNTTDTDAWLQIEFTDTNIQSGTYNLTLINLKDHSKFEHEGIAFNSNPFYYKLDSGADMLKNEIKHAGTWIGQLVVTLDKGQSTTQQFIFDIESHILDGEVASVTMLEGYSVLMAQIENAKELLDQYNIDYAALLANLEATYNSRLFSVEQQLEQAKADLQAGIGALTVDAEVVTARNSAVKGKTFAVLDERIEDIESDSYFSITNLIANGDFSNGSSGFSLTGTTPPTLTTNDTKVGTNAIEINTVNASSIVTKDVVTPIGSKIYVGGWVKILSFVESPSVDIVIEIDDIGTYNNPVYVRANKNIIGEWQYVSGIKTTTVAGVKVCGGYTGATTRKIRIDGLITIDLSATFGAGKEPTVAEMDRLMARFPNSWFDGTKNLFQAKQALTKQIALDARTEFDAENLITNGDFSNGSSGFSLTGSTSPTLTTNDTKVGTNAIEISTVNASSIVTKDVVTPIGSKIYVAGWVKILSFTESPPVDIVIEINDIGTYNNPVYVRANKNIIGGWQYVSGIKTTTVGGVKVCGGFTGAATRNIRIDGLLTIDLTATFGAGKEPTVAEMDRLMARFPNSWFDGVRPIQTIETLYQEKANKVQEAWITPTLVNSWVAFDTRTAKYKKADYGRVYLKGIVKNGTIGATIFTLPTGYRPDETLIFGVITINIDGTVVCASGVNTSVSLSGVNFFV